MNIAQAMKQKNRLIKKIRTLGEDIQSENSMLEGSERQVDVKATMEKREALVKELIQLKMRIFRASEPMRDKILRMGELKGQIQFLGSINTRHGKVSEYGDTVITYEAVYTRTWVREQIEAAEKEIDEIQDQLDTFNHKTEV